MVIQNKIAEGVKLIEEIMLWNVLERRSQGKRNR